MDIRSRLSYVLWLNIIIGFSMIAFSATASEKKISDLQFRQLVSNLDRAATKPLDEPVRIAIIYPGLQESDYWQRSIKALRGRLDDLNIPYSLDIRFSKPYVESDLQETQILEILEKDPDYLIYTINSHRQQRIVESLLTRARPKLIIQNLTQPIATWFDMQPLMYVGFDHAQGARYLAEHFKATFPQNTPYGILFWGEGVLSEQRGGVFENNIGDYHDLKVSYFTDASREKAKRATLSMLADHPSIRYIYACSTDVALGALDALQAIERDDVFVNGWGGGEAELKVLKQGKLDIVLMRMNDQSGIAIAEAIRLDMHNVQIPQVFAGDFHIITTDMPTKTIDQLIEQAFIYSGKPEL